MSRIIASAWIAVLWLACVPLSARAEEAPHTTDAQELTNSEYWILRYNAMMLEIALAQHQPDLAIHYALDNAIHIGQGLTRQYPKDSEVAAMARKLKDADARLNLSDPTKNAFSKSCPWLATSFGDAWVKFHMAEETFKAGHKDDAADGVNDTKAALAYLTAAVMKEWPDELKKSVEKMRTDIAALEKQVKG